MRIAFLHTVGFLVERFRTLMRDAHPEVDSFHILNEGLLQDLLRHGASPAITRRIVAQALLAAEAGADLVVFTCSSTSPAVDLARRMTEVPILKIDDPMAARAVAIGGRIGLVCTARSTVPASEGLIRAHAAEAGRAVEIETILLDDAYAALMAGDRDRHDAMVTAEARALAGRVDVLVLAQASLAHLRDGLASDGGTPVLASPPLLMEEIGRRVRGE